MEHPNQLLETFTDLYEGDPWLDVTLTGTLNAISAEQAAYKKSPQHNSIWEIANHIVSWRINVLERLHGVKIDTPAHNYFLPIEDTSSLAWEQTLANLWETQEKWVAYFENLQPSDLNNVYPPNGYTNYKHIHGILQHDAYHLGQIVMLAKHPE